ncbi:MAG: hypothetical protein E4H02_02655 [Lentisphaerales bacterium]|jgi:hypothetical protein|nr:MAG: hypothetical protein E4H02_02655 [Lentisphaerales bacterium]
MILARQYDVGLEGTAAESRIVSHVSAACRDSGFDAEDCCVSEIAKGVVASLVCLQSPFSVEDGQLSVMASRALRGLGRHDLAWRVLLFGNGVARKSESLFAGGGRMWVLDMKKLRFPKTGGLEMALFVCVSSVLNCLADAWDVSGGSGALGLKHVEESEALALGSRVKRRETQRLAREVVAFCSRKLELLQVVRNWTSVPSLMILGRGATM